MTKYRLKKDTPEFKAGTVFDMIENIDVGKVLTMNAPREDYYAFEVDSVDNFDEWFEEVKESKREPEWVRKQIRQVIFDNSRRDIIGWEYTDMEYVYIKDYYYYDSQTSFGFREEGTRMKFRFFEKTNSPERDNVLRYFNQLVRDGYIEIKDNPNIVWEDGDD